MTLGVDKNLILNDVLRVKSELGHFPSFEEYLVHGRFSKYHIKNKFGSWFMFLQASGMAYTENKEKPNKEELKKEAFEHLQKEVLEKKSVARPPKIIHRLLCISDLHKPYGHKDTTPFLFALDDKYKFDHILLGGDEIDAHSFSFHDHDPNLFSPGHELEEAIRHLEPLYKRWLVVDVLESNHGSMSYRKSKHHGLPRQVLKSYNEILRAPEGWKWSEELTLQFSDGKKAIAHHGYSANILQASQTRGTSIIQFHFHNNFSIQYWNNRDELSFALQCGCLIDDLSASMAYNKLTVKRPIIGCASVINGFPVLFPMPLDKSGRWNGVVP